MSLLPIVKILMQSNSATIKYVEAFNLVEKKSFSAYIMANNMKLSC